MVVIDPTYVRTIYSDVPNACVVTRERFEIETGRWRRYVFLAAKFSCTVIFNILQSHRLPVRTS